MRKYAYKSIEKTFGRKDKKVIGARLEVQCDLGVFSVGSGVTVSKDILYVSLMIGLIEVYFSLFRYTIPEFDEEDYLARLAGVENKVYVEGM